MEIDICAKETYVCYDEASQTVTFYCDNFRSERKGKTYLFVRDQYDDYVIQSVESVDGTVVDTLDTSRIRWAVFDRSFSALRPRSTADWFSCWYSLRGIIGIEHLNTSEVTTMVSMFEDCESLRHLDLRGFCFRPEFTYDQALFPWPGIRERDDLDRFSTHELNGVRCLCAQAEYAWLSDLYGPRHFSRFRVDTTDMFTGVAEDAVILLPCGMSRSVDADGHAVLSMDEGGANALAGVNGFGNADAHRNADAHANPNAHKGPSLEPIALTKIDMAGLVSVSAKTYDWVENYEISVLRRFEESLCRELAGLLSGCIHDPSDFQRLCDVLHQVHSQSQGHSQHQGHYKADSLEIRFETDSAGTPIAVLLSFSDLTASSSYRLSIPQFSDLLIHLVSTKLPPKEQI